jgi:adenylosuccinate synthase
MPVSVVVGGQFGSEGKGKVALHVARTSRAAAVVRVGGPNSGHTAVDTDGSVWSFRQLPAAALARDALIVLPAGSLIDPQLLAAETGHLEVNRERLLIDPRASVVLPRHRQEELAEGLHDRIGSTASGTGAALRDRISRSPKHILARDHPSTRPYICDGCSEILRHLLNQGSRVVVEGTQGFGLSIWHGSDYPHLTSRDTTAAGFVAEAGLAPHDVDEVVMVIRSFPIRVGGNSGKLEKEIDWPTLAAEARLPPDYVELTSATRRVRRVARFDPQVVRRAITVNAPHLIVLNHLDYVDPDAIEQGLGPKARQFIKEVELAIDRSIDLVGLSPSILISTEPEQIVAAV